MGRPTQPVVSLQASRADTFFIAAGPKSAAQAIRKTFDPGLDEAISIIVATSFKSIDDPRCEPDPDYVAWRHFMRDAYAEGI